MLAAYFKSAKYLVEYFGPHVLGVDRISPCYFWESFIAFSSCFHLDYLCHVPINVFFIFHILLFQIKPKWLHTFNFFVYFAQLFMANTDRANIVKHYLKEPIKARYVRINPRAWHGIHICMRFEVFGCQEGMLSFFLLQLSGIGLHAFVECSAVHTKQRIQNSKSFETMNITQTFQ